MWQRHVSLYRAAVELSGLALERNVLWLASRLSTRAGVSKQVYVEQRLAEYRAMWARVASSTGRRFTALGDDLWQIDAGDARALIRNDELQFDDPVTRTFVVRKPLVHALLAGAGLPVPEHEAFTLADLSPAQRFADRHPGGSVVKPASGYAGRGVTTHVRDGREVRAAAVRAAIVGRELMIEPMIPGASYRLLVLEGRVIDAVRRTGPRVIGDGRTPIQGLIDAENERRARAGRRQAPIEPDRDLWFTLASQGLTVASTPAVGRVVVLKSTDARSGQFRNVRTVYTDPALDVLCDSIRRDAETAAAIVGCDFLGVDVITLDPSIPLRHSGGVINEVNTGPALHHHYDPAVEPFPRVAPIVLETLLRRSRTRHARLASAGAHDAIASPRREAFDEAGARNGAVEAVPKLAGAAP